MSAITVSTLTCRAAGDRILVSIASFWGAMRARQVTKYKTNRLAEETAYQIESLKADVDELAGSHARLEEKLDRVLELLVAGPPLSQTQAVDGAANDAERR